MADVSYWATKQLAPALTESRPMSEEEAVEEGYTILATIEGGCPTLETSQTLTPIQQDLIVNQGVLPDA